MSCEDADVIDEEGQKQQQNSDGQGKLFENIDSAELAGRVRVALRQFVDKIERHGQPLLPTLRFNNQEQSEPRPVRQANLSKLDITLLSRWLESSLNPNTGHQAADQEAEQLGYQLQARSGNKMIRNGQPVFMRLPPRFGKRS